MAMAMVCDWEDIFATRTPKNKVVYGLPDNLVLGHRVGSAASLPDDNIS
jgi:hypothetical protein